MNKNAQFLPLCVCVCVCVCVLSLGRCLPFFLFSFPFLGWMLGMSMGQGGAEGWGLSPHPAWFYLAPSPPHMTEKTF